MKRIFLIVLFIILIILVGCNRNEKKEYLIEQKFYNTTSEELQQGEWGQVDKGDILTLNLYFNNTNSKEIKKIEVQVSSIEFVEANQILLIITTVKLKILATDKEINLFNKANSYDVIGLSK